MVKCGSHLVWGMVWCLLVVSTLCCLATGVQAGSTPVAEAPEVMTQAGAVRGSVRETPAGPVLEFKGIPYAAPPVGELRWQLPQPPQSWSGVREATHYGGACPQLSRYGLTEASEDEDCLTLNVTVPAASIPKQPKPVLVWIHGGAFVGGSSALYPLDYLALSGDLVLVSLNYRLGVFGFMAHPTFDADHNGSFGLEDQRAALRWVQRNIAAFGGDPENVTIAGESAGAAGVCMHLIAPDETKGLFHKAIIQSAGCAQPMQTVEEAKDFGARVAARVGCAGGAADLDCLRGKPVQELLEAGSTEAGSNLMAFEPSIGSRSIPQQGAEALAKGEFVQVPLLNGGNRDELRLYVAYDLQAGQKITDENYPELVAELYGEHGEAVLGRYPLRDYSSAPAALGTVMTDYHPTVGLNVCTYLETGKRAARYVPVYQYEFADRDAPPVTENPGFEMGAVHSAELPY